MTISALTDTPNRSVAMRYPQNNLAACMVPWSVEFKLDIPVFEKHVHSSIVDGYVLI